MGKLTTKDELATWQARWQLVNEVQLEELRRKTPEERLRELARLMAAAEHFGWKQQLAEEKEQARQRWLQLYRAYGIIR